MFHHHDTVPALDGDATEALPSCLKFGFGTLITMVDKPSFQDYYPLIVASESIQQRH